MADTKSQKEEVEVKTEDVKEIPVLRYKMNLYTPSGLLRAEISKSAFSQISVRYGDIVRAVSLNHWSTLDEIVQSYYNLSKRLRFEPLRSKEQISKALDEMVEAGMTEVK